MEPSASHTIDVTFTNTPAALPRLMLVFSRRRIRVRSMVLNDAGEHAPASLSLGFDFDGPLAHTPSGLDGFLEQLRRLVEVESVEVVALGGLEVEEQGRVAA